MNSDSEYSNSNSDNEIPIPSTGKTGKSKYNDYMKNYMREYRKKQKLQQEEKRHSCCICNKLCEDTEVEALIKKAVGTMINIINDNSAMVSEERIARINDSQHDFFRYAHLIIDTVEELRNIHLNQ